MTTTTRIYFGAWGRGIDRLEMPAYAMLQPGESRSDAVYRSICARSGLVLCGGPRSDGRSADGDLHYQATLGTRCRGGGWTPQAEVWISISQEGGK